VRLDRQEPWGAASSCGRCRRVPRQIAADAWVDRGEVRQGESRAWCRELDRDCRWATGHDCQLEEADALGLRDVPRLRRELRQRDACRARRVVARRVHAAELWRDEPIASPTGLDAEELAGLGARLAKARRGVAKRTAPPELGALPDAQQARADVAEQRRELRMRRRARPPRAAATELLQDSSELRARLPVRPPAKVTSPKMAQRSRRVRKLERADAVPRLTAEARSGASQGLCRCLYRAATAWLAPRRREQLAAIRRALAVLL
jgi:hypothetical protein